MKLIEQIRSEFSYISQGCNGRSVVYFDNAATSQRPDSLLRKLDEWQRYANANVHRAVHCLSANATENYEAARAAVKDFINASSEREIIFTSGTTSSINLLANIFSQAKIGQGDTILITQAEHHSNMVPWQMVCKSRGARLEYIPIKKNGEWDLSILDGLLASSRVKIISAAHISNVLGIVNPVEELIKKAHSYGVPVHIDGAQGIVHSKVDVRALDCDFYSFSGHKMYAATGTGVLYGKLHFLEELPPWMGGGDMVDTVTYSGTTYNVPPLKFEAGTPNFIGQATLLPAIEFMKQLRSSEMIENEKRLIAYLEEELRRIDGLRVLGDSPARTLLFSFVVDGVHHSDIATLMDQMGFALRSGLLCSEPLIEKYGYNGVVRISPAPYNTMEECERFIKSLGKVISMLK